MALENFIGTLSNVPSDYGIPVPTGIKKFLENVINLPKPASSENYGYYTKFKVVSNMYYVTALNDIGNHDDTVTNAGVATYFRFVDPNSVFILPNSRQNIFPYNYKMLATNGYPPIIESEVGQNDNKSPFIYAFPADKGGYRGGAISVNTDEEYNSVSFLSDGIDVICRVSFTYHNADENQDYSGTDTISIISSLGMYKGFSTIYSDYSSHVSNLGRSVKLGYNVFRQDTIFANRLSTHVGGRGFSAYLNDILLVNSTFDNARQWNNSNNISSDLFYLLFPRVVFADTASRIDTLLNMTAEDFKKEIKYDIGKNPYAPVNPSAPSGGNGSYGSGENYFDTIGRIPNGSAEANDSRNGLYTRYLMTSGELGTLGEYLWADELGLQVAKTLISLLYGDPVQTVISCVSYPFNLSSLTSSSNVSFFWGGHDSGLSFNALNQNAFSIDWGTIFLSEYWGNFLDYSPHTQMQLYLPWGTGFVHIDPNDILNANSNSSWTGTGTLGIKTNVDLSRGICVHNVIANNTVIGSYSGSCGRQIPITGSDYASKQVAMAGAAIGAMAAGAISAGMGSHAASKGHNIFGDPPSDINRRHMTKSSVKADIFGSEAKAVGKMAMRPAIASAAAIAVSPPSVSRSGSFQEGAGSLSIQEPYLIISRPKMSLPENYGHMYGYPSNISSNLSSLTGYTEVGAIHIDGISATSQEIDEIESLLMGGVIL